MTATQKNRIFYLRTPEQLFLKFHSDLKNLKETLDPNYPHSRGYEQASYHAFNAAITAWHLTDWVWNSFTEENMRLLPQILNTDNQIKDLPAFQRYLRSRCRALAICWEVANGSKHFTSPESTKVDAKTEVKSKLATAGEFRAGEPLQKITYDFVLEYNGEKLRLVDVFDEARNFWHDLLHRFKIIYPILVDMTIDVTITRNLNISK